MVRLRGGDGESTSSGHVSARYEIGEDESPGYALVEILATLSGEAETEMETLYDHVDLEALDTLLGSTADSPHWSASVQLEMADSVVFVSGDAVIVMADPVAGE